MSAATTTRRQRFARKLRASHTLYGNLVTGLLALYIAIDIPTGFLFSYEPGSGGPKALGDNPLLAFLGVLVIPGSILLTVVGTLWIYDNQRATDTDNSCGVDALNWTRRIWGAIYLFIATFMALTFMPNADGGFYVSPLFGLIIFWLVGRLVFRKR